MNKFPAYNIDNMSGTAFLMADAVRTSFPFRSDCQSEVDLGSAYRLAPQSLGQRLERKID